MVASCESELTAKVRNNPYLVKLRNLMLGINAQTGQLLAGIDHLRQSIRGILTTRIGTRVMRRDYGSRLPALVDNPMPPRLAMDLYSATAEAVARWISSVVRFFTSWFHSASKALPMGLAASLTFL